MLLRMMTLLFAMLLASISTVAANVSFIIGPLGPHVKEGTVTDILSLYDAVPVKVDLKLPFALVTMTPDQAAKFEVENAVLFD